MCCLRTLVENSKFIYFFWHIGLYGLCVQFILRKEIENEVCSSLYAILKDLNLIRMVSKEIEKQTIQKTL